MAIRCIFLFALVLLATHAESRVSLRGVDIPKKNVADKKTEVLAKKEDAAVLSATATNYANEDSQASSDEAKAEADAAADAASAEAEAKAKAASTKVEAKAEAASTKVEAKAEAATTTDEQDTDAADQKTQDGEEDSDEDREEDSEEESEEDERGRGDGADEQATDAANQKNQQMQDEEDGEEDNDEDGTHEEAVNEANGQADKKQSENNTDVSTKTATSFLQIDGDASPAEEDTFDEQVNELDENGNPLFQVGYGNLDEGGWIEDTAQNTPEEKPTSFLQIQESKAEQEKDDFYKEGEEVEHDWEADDIANKQYEEDQTKSNLMEQSDDGTQDGHQELQTDEDVDQAEQQTDENVEHELQTQADQDENDEDVEAALIQTSAKAKSEPGAEPLLPFHGDPDEAPIPAVQPDFSGGVYMPFQATLPHYR